MSFGSSLAAARTLVTATGKSIYVCGPSLPGLRGYPTILTTMCNSIQSSKSVSHCKAVRVSLTSRFHSASIVIWALSGPAKLPRPFLIFL